MNNENTLVSLDDAALDDVNGGWSISFGKTELASGGGSLGDGYLKYGIKLFGQSFDISLPVLDIKL